MKLSASFAIHTSGPVLYAGRIGSGASDDGDILALQNANGMLEVLVVIVMT